MSRAVTGVAGLACLVLGLALSGPVLQTVAETATPAAEVTELGFDVQFRDTFLSESDAGPSLGDRIILNDLLFADNGKEAGHTSGVCTVTDVAGELLCNIVFALEDGTISTQFLNTPPPLKTFPIIGGTGAYQGASGIGDLQEFPDQTGALTFHLSGAD